jgi:hypothetical protein
MKHIKKYNESSEIDALTIEEFSNLREAMYAVKTSNSPSASQSKSFFSDDDNFDRVIEKLRGLLTYKEKKDKFFDKE